MAHTTSLTLLERLRTPGDQEAWESFARLYTPLLYYWCRKAGLYEQDASDLVQDVFVTLVKKLPEFQYDHQKSFRSWLRVVTLSKWRERHRKPVLEVAASASIIESIESRPDDWQFAGDEYRTQLIHSALPIIEPEFSATAWQAFKQHVVEGHDATEVAARLGIRVGTVYAAKSRVLARLRLELQGFLDT